MSTGVASRLDRFRPDLASIGVWLASRLTVLITAVYASWVLTGQPGVFMGGPGELAPERSPVAMWDRWDVGWYRSIAEEGYLAPGHENNIAFPPGLPLLLRVFDCRRRRRHARGPGHQPPGRPGRGQSPSAD